MRKLCPNFVTKLEPYQVFVMGSNDSGFHGAGSAGYAQRGVAANTWRDDEAFRKALSSPKKDPLRKGKWSFLGQGRGYQEGLEGSSYAIATVKKAGQRRSIPLEEILSQLRELAEFAKEHPEKEFLCCITGGGYNGYSIKEIQGVYEEWCNDPPPDNILLQKDYEFRGALRGL